jgi:selenocysteine lyase/cysteine desulfurase
MPRASSSVPPKLPDDVRPDFAWAERETFFDSAYYHPMSSSVRKAVNDYLDFRVGGPGSGRSDFDGARGQGSLADLKARFAPWIGAKPSEIAFVQSTSDGENVIISGLELARRGGNVVLTDLHYHSSFYMYRMLERLHGLEVRVVPSRQGTVSLEDVRAAVDERTRLVSIALVSNQNGYLHDARGISEIAHGSGSYLYADVVQAAGAVPIDVRAMGIDFCACSTYKWLMGERGFGFLYVREELQDELTAARWGHRQYRSFDERYRDWDLLPGGARFETGNVSNLGALTIDAALRYLETLGLGNIQAHAKTLVDRLQEELPRLGFPSLTPRGNPTPIAAFGVDDPQGVERSLARAGVVATVSPRSRRLRLSVTVFNDQRDVDRLLQALRTG